MNDIGTLFLSKSRGYLTESYLPKLERALEAVSDDDIWWRPNESSNSIGNLLMHLTGNVRQWIISGIGDAPDTRERQKEFDEREKIPAGELLDRLRSTLSEVDSVLENLD